MKASDIDSNWPMNIDQLILDYIIYVDSDHILHLEVFLQFANVTSPGTTCVYGAERTLRGGQEDEGFGQTNF